MRSIILVGGRGTRLRPLTLHQPKPLLPIFNKPFISYQLDILKEAKVSELVLAAGQQAAPWIHAIRRLSPKGIKITLSIEKKPMGTGGAIREAYEKFSKKKPSEDEPVSVFNGDVFLNLDLRSLLTFHNKRKSRGSIVLTKVSDVSRYGVVQFDQKGRVKRFREKTGRKNAGFINAGAYLLNSSLIQKIPRRPSSVERDIFPQYLRSGIPMYAYPIRGYWNDIGTPQTYLQAHADLFRTKNRWTDQAFLRRTSVPRQKNGGQAAAVLKGKRSRIGANVSFFGVNCIGNNVQIGSNSVIRDSIVMDGGHIGPGVTMSRCVIGRNCRIGENAILKDGVVLGEKSVVSPFSKV